MSRRGLLAALGGLGVCLLAAALGWVLFASSLLAVHRIDVAGEQRTSRTQLLDAAGVRTGTPLARVDVGSVSERVAALRVVESVQVRRAWLSTLRITVHERVPVAAVPRGRRYLLLDDEGVRVATVSEAPNGLPVVRIRGGARGGREVANDSALHVVGELPGRVAVTVRTVTVDSDGGVRLRLRDGATVIWGKPRHGREKARILAALLRRHDANTYDVRSPEVVTTG